jgi:hypothetical protein
MSFASFQGVEVTFEGVEAGGPQRSIGGEPVVDLAERVGAHAVEAVLRGDTGFDEAGVAEHAQVFGDGGLADAEGVDEVADGALPVGAEEVEDAPAIGFGEDGERGHRVS